MSPGSAGALYGILHFAVRKPGDADVFRSAAASTALELRGALRDLREHRKAAGLSQMEVAEKLGRYQSYVNKAESGGRSLRY
jgi:helix-turn-helix protein